MMQGMDQRRVPLLLGSGRIGGGCGGNQMSLPSDREGGVMRHVERLC
jgi:hypothetical protein